jgi:hypothetical protein
MPHSEDDPTDITMASSTRITQDQGRHTQQAAEHGSHDPSHCVDLNRRKAFPKYPYRLLDFLYQVQFEFVYSQRVDMIALRECIFSVQSFRILCLWINRRERYIVAT